MSSTYFKTSNIEKLTNKSRNKNKNKKVSDKEAEDDKDEKIIEGFEPTNMLGDKDSGDGKSPSSNIFSSSDNDNSKKKDDITNPTSFIGTKKSNTQKNAEEQMNPNSILIFCIHALLSVLFAYVWGWLSTNFLYLATESEENLDYILPIDEYELPYTNKLGNCYFNYGFPYNLGSGRIIRTSSQLSDRDEIKRRQKDITYYLWLSKEGSQDDKSEVGFFKALVQYIFEAVYGGLGINGGRYAMRMILSIFSISDSLKEDRADTWERMKERTFLKIAAFLSWPIIMQFIFPVIGIWSGVTSFIFGILQNHIIWGLIFSFTIGIFIAMGCGFYMVLNALYVFFIYPWSNDNSNTKGKWRKIFDNLIPYMLLIFYFQICIYGYKDLGPSGGAGIMFIVIVSIILQYMQHSN